MAKRYSSKNKTNLWYLKSQSLRTGLIDKLLHIYTRGNAREHFTAAFVKEKQSWETTQCFNAPHLHGPPASPNAAWRPPKHHQEARAEPMGKAEITDGVSQTS